LIETSNDYARGLLHGIRDWIREHHAWSIYLAEQSRGDRPPSWLARWNGDGIIARIETPEIARAVRRSGLPAVDMSAARLLPQLPWVETDDQAIAALAADHLLERGFQHLAYCGDSRFHWSQWRGEAFEAFLASRGMQSASYEPRTSKPAGWEKELADLRAWIKKLPRPVGIFACYDSRGRQVIEACRQLGLAVPDDVAVLGVDNDDLLCDLCDPPMSSIEPDTRQSGYVAASLLDAKMRGENIPPEAHRIRPLGVVVRQSTDVVAVNDREISEAVRFIREHACDGIQVTDVLQRTTLSRRVFETRFRQLIGHSPHEQIVRIRLERAKQLMRDTELSLAVIARRSGFRHAEYLSVVFSQKVGQSPSRYRLGDKAAGDRSS
jgi:LacI family transcriptional regulator